MNDTIKEENSFFFNFQNTWIYHYFLSAEYLQISLQNSQWFLQEQITSAYSEVFWTEMEFTETIKGGSNKM